MKNRKHGPHLPPIEGMKIELSTLDEAIFLAFPTKTQKEREQKVVNGKPWKVYAIQGTIILDGYIQVDETENPDSVRFCGKNSAVNTYSKQRVKLPQVYRLQELRETEQKEAIVIGYELKPNSQEYSRILKWLGYSFGEEDGLTRIGIFPYRNITKTNGTANKQRNTALELLVHK